MSVLVKLRDPGNVKCWRCYCFFAKGFYEYGCICTVIIISIHSWIGCIHNMWNWNIKLTWVELSRVLHPAQHTIGHNGDNAPSLLNHLADINKTKHSYVQEQHSNLINDARKQLSCVLTEAVEDNAGDVGVSSHWSYTPVDIGWAVIVLTVGPVGLWLIVCRVNELVTLCMYVLGRRLP